MSLSHLKIRKLLVPVVYLFLVWTVSSKAANNDSIIVAGADSTQIAPSANEKYLIIHTISVTGNNRTKTRIIFRELTLHAGDTILPSALEALIMKSRNNILNTHLFNFVRIDTIPWFRNQIDILVDVKERWYLFPIPTFDIAERNFNTWLENPNLERASYGFFLVDNNFRGLKSNLTFQFRIGYAQQLQITYAIPYLNKKQTSGLGCGFSYNRNREIYYSTENNQLDYYKNTDFVREEWVGKLNYSLRTGFYTTQTAEIRYVQSSISDSLASLNKDYFGGGATQFQLFIAGYRFRRDCRDSKAYPLKGYFLGFDLVKQGLGILKNESANLFYVSASARKYWQLFDRFYFDAMIKGKLTDNEQPPYYLQSALGYGDYVRGYEYYVIDGQSFSLLKTNFHYQLVRPSVYHVNSLQNERFNTIPYAVYLTLFADAAYVEDNYYFKNNPLTNNLLIGGGAGVDFVTYYDIVIRMECSMNRMEQVGLFLHFVAPF